ncbi:MAG: DUF222 domain-containing protein, partial [Actinobacteria bacterium]|nr:DUF222 domain-containing protein [Actinomycetota bacterium]
RATEQIVLFGAGVIASRSMRDAGHSGLAQKQGHRNTTSLLQDLGGMSKSEAARQARVGADLLAGSFGAGAGGEADDSGIGSGEGEASTPASSAPWHEPLGRALREGRVSSAQFDAIRRGLGEPPEGAVEAWRVAADELVAEAQRRTVEELGAHARAARDLLDPEGAAARFEERCARRSFRTWVDHDGVRRSSMIHDDEGGAFIEAVLAAALRPRRGGPRFVADDERVASEELIRDDRTNDQLAYDLFLDVIRAGVLADAKTVFGVRQPGLRLVQAIDPDGVRGATSMTEDGLLVFPAAIADRRLCDTGATIVTVDSCGNPLDVGREQRLFTSRQRIGLAVRDGGCRWPACGLPASYCEAHHIDEWGRDQGRTDVDRGILLCRFHHLQLHNGGWRITRHEKDEFVLHDRTGRATVMTRRLPLRYLWSDVDPPPKRFRPAA